MTIEELMDLQEAGARACVLGLKAYENPYPGTPRTLSIDEADGEEHLAKHDAWRFGWEVEHASQQSLIDNHLATHVPRRSAAR